MAAAVSMGTAPARVNHGSSAAEEEQLYAHLLQLQDTVIAGQHSTLKLPPAAIAQLKASLIVPDAATANGVAATTDPQTLQSSPATRIPSLPGLHAQAAPVQTGPAAVSAFAAKSRGLDPIFLEKSSSLVRAEGQLKRQRIERDLQAQVEQRRHAARGGDPAAEGLSRIDIDAVLTAALSRVPPRSGLQSARPASASSFDENDYYSSQAPSEWSSDDDGSKHSDKGAGDFTAGFERPNPAAKATSGSHAHPTRIPQKRTQPDSFVAHSTKARSQYYPDDEPDDVDDMGDEDEDEEYTPPDAAAFDSARMGDTLHDAQQPTDVDDDNSDYEPGEITQDSTVLTPHNQQAPPAQPPAHVIRNHLTHLAAPQPNRVSPLTTAKGPGFELELVNGQPEVIQKERAPPRSMPTASRASTASPANGGSGNKKKRAKKRKREQVRDDKATKRNKRPEDKRAFRQGPQTGQEPYIKDEPFSPPPLLANVPEAPQYPPPQFRPAPAHVDLSSPSQHLHYAPEQPRAPPRYEYPPAASSAVLRVASPAAYQPKQRDTQDLRRMASLQYAQKAPSPPPQASTYSPVAPYQPRYQEGPQVQEMQYVRAPSPPRQPEYQEGYSCAQSPAMMSPPPPKRIIVDQYGNRYYAADPGPAPATAVSARASVAPVDRRFEHQPTFERASSHLAYAPQPPTRYEPSYSTVPPPSQPPARRYEQPVEYIDSNGYRVRQQPEQTSPTYQPQPRYEAMPPPQPAPAEPTSPVYREVPRYDQMLPPPPPQPREPTSPVYQQAPRAYSARPEIPAPAGYARQASVAPAPYARQEMPPPAAPQRAVSVMPGGAAEYPQYAPQPSYGYAPAPPQAVKYVDQYGREMYPQQLRPASEYRYQ
ncbi:hypothetical protein D0859_15024 [Hortaea werneckii]|uniref:Uncharacterized protein n=1 Tax=Hortaea werneckii TaxID=91943 RepID=A0A3M7I6N3_HORWE|nr:hypothetical protein D0859_15024 [Hortaea werneckii]